VRLDETPGLNLSTLTRRGFVIGTAMAAASPRGVSAAGQVPFDNWKAISHAKSWCGKKSNPCGKYFEGGKYSDCAHFVAHCLAAGGLKIKADPGFNPCPDGLAVRNTDLVAALRDFIKKGHSNVTEIGLSDAIIGDIGFLDRPDRPYHAFMIAAPVDLRKIPPPAVQVWAHSVSRCSEAMDAQWKQWFSSAFRITDG